MWRTAVPDPCPKGGKKKKKGKPKKKDGMESAEASKTLLALENNTT